MTNEQMDGRTDGWTNAPEAICPSNFFEVGGIIKRVLKLVVIVSLSLLLLLYLFVCVEVLQPRQPNGVMSSTVSLPNHTFTGQALSTKQLTSIVYILSPETDNCPLESAEGRE